MRRMMEETIGSFEIIRRLFKFMGVWWLYETFVFLFLLEKSVRLFRFTKAKSIIDFHVSF